MNTTDNSQVLYEDLLNISEDKELDKLEVDICTELCSEHISEDCSNIYDNVKDDFIYMEFDIDKYEEFVEIMKVFLDTDTTYLSFGEYFDILKNNVNPNYYSPHEITKHFYFMNFFVQLFTGMTRDQIILIIDENAHAHKKEFMEEFEKVIRKEKPIWIRGDLDEPLLSLDILNPFGFSNRITMEFPIYVDRKNTFHLWAFYNVINKKSNMESVEFFSYVSITSEVMSRVPYYVCDKEKLYIKDEAKHKFIALN